MDDIVDETWCLCVSVCVFVWRFRRCGVEQTRQRFRRSVNLSVRLSARLDQGSGKVKVEEEGTAKTDQQPLAVVSLMSLMMVLQEQLLHI